MIQLTTLPAAASPTDAVSAIVEYDAERPDGLTKEIIARAAALMLVKAAGDAGALAELHDLLDPTVTAAVAGGAGVVNPVVKRIIALDALSVPPGQSASDATAALAGAVYDAVQHKPLTIPSFAPSQQQQPPATDVPVSPLFSSAAIATPSPCDLTGLDLLADEFEPLRFVLTRTLAAVRPALYDRYRRIKDGGTATARADAYEFAFGVLATLIEQSKGPGGA